MKAKEYVDAIKCYGKALEIHPEDAATYSNRALAYLKTKEYARALEDADSAIKLKEDYLKAYHRRGKAYAALNKLELAVRDFQFILEKEPNNKEAMNEVKSARKKLDDKLIGSNAKTPAPVSKEIEKKFVRVAIQEESDEDEEQKAEQPATFQVVKDSAEDPVIEDEVVQQKMVEVLDSKENPNWWKKSSETLNPDDFKPTAEAPIGGANGFKRIEIDDDSSEGETEVKEENAKKISEQAESLKQAALDAQKHADKLDATIKEHEDKQRQVEKEMQEKLKLIEKQKEAAAALEA